MADDVDSHESGVLATRQGREYISVLLYNMNDRLDAEGEKMFYLRLEQVPLEFSGGRLIHYRIDRRHSSSYAEFERLGCPSALTEDQVQQIRKCQDLQMLEPVSELNIKDGVFCKSVVMSMHSASLLVLVPKTAQGPQIPDNLLSIKETTYWGNLRIILKWNPDNHAGFTHFDIERSVKLAGPYIRLNEAEELSTSMYFDEEIGVGTKYYYRVRSVNASGLVSDWSDIVSVIT